MRVAHVVSLVSADGAFGGPVAVVRAQTAALAARGHEVHVFAGWDGRARLEIPGADVHLVRARRLVPGTGFSGLIAPGLMAAMRANGPFDAVHVHLGRHLLDLRAARAAARTPARLILQPHGMVMPSRAGKARLLDLLATRPVLHAASAVLVLTAAEEEGVAVVAERAVPVVRIANGIPVGAAAPRSGPRGRSVLFLARLHPRKRVLAFAEAAAMLHEAGDAARFSVVGPDEGDLPALQRLRTERGLESVLEYEGSLPSGAGAARIAEADVYVLPAEREVFPMSVLEALSVGTPVVLARDCGIAPELEAAGAAVVVDGTPASIAEAVRGLLDDPDRWRGVAERGRDLLRDRMSIDAVAELLLAAYAGSSVGDSAIERRRVA